MYFVSDTSKFRVEGLMAYSYVEVRPSYLPFGAMDCIDFISTTDNIEPYYSRSNSNSSDQENSLDNDIIISSSASTISVNNNSIEENILDEEDNSEYYMQFSWPDDSDNECDYDYDDNNDDLYINNHLNRKQINSIDILEDNKFQRSKRSNKKISAQCQIKTKYAKSIKYKSHNKQLYMHHRLYKQVRLDPPTRHYMPSSSSVLSYTPEVLRTSTNNNSVIDKPSVHRTNTANQLQAYTISAHNIPNEPAFDDAMINFLLDMQNRDLSPNDYDMLLRLDERVQRKTVNKNVLDKFPTVNVNDTHLNEQCTICLETYSLGQQLKLLPCTHMFHVNCIETYLKEFSTQCPLDNLSLI